eukprot:3038419-Rhodomonas_salina.3
MVRLRPREAGPQSNSKLSSKIGSIVSSHTWPSLERSGPPHHATSAFVSAYQECAGCLPWQFAPPAAP